MVWLTFMQKCGSVGIFWALLASMDLILRGKYVNCVTYKTRQNKEAPAFYLVPRILLYIHTVLPILPNQSPQKELLFEDELIACFSTQNGRKKTRCECRFKQLAQNAKEDKQGVKMHKTFVCCEWTLTKRQKTCGHLEYFLIFYIRPRNKTTYSA